MRRKICLVILVLFVTSFITPVTAISISKNVVFNPTQVPWKVAWNYPYQDDYTAIVGATWIKIGGIKFWMDVSTSTNVIVNEWSPNNKNKDGKTVFEFSVVTDQDTEYTIYFGGLVPSHYYTIYKNDNKWKVVKTDEDGVLSFTDESHSSIDYVIVTGGVVALPVITPPVEKTWLDILIEHVCTYWWLIVIVLFILLLLLWRRRGE